MIERDPEINKREKKSYIGVTVYPIEGEGRGRNEIAKRAKAFETLLSPLLLSIQQHLFHFNVFI